MLPIPLSLFSRCFIVRIFLIIVFIIFCIFSHSFIFPVGNSSNWTKYINIRSCKIRRSRARCWLQISLCSIISFVIIIFVFGKSEREREREKNVDTLKCTIYRVWIRHTEDTYSTHSGWLTLLMVVSFGNADNPL